MLARLFIVLACVLAAEAVSCPGGTVTTDAELQALANAVPGCTQFSSLINFAVADTTTGTPLTGFTSLAGLSIGGASTVLDPGLLFPDVTSTNSLFVANHVLTSLTFTSLETAGSILVDCDSLVTLSFPALTTTTDRYPISNNFFGGIIITGELIETIEIPELTTINLSAHLYMKDLTSLTTLDVASTPGGFIHQGNVYMYGASSLTTFGFSFLDAQINGILYVTGMDAPGASFDPTINSLGGLSLSGSGFEDLDAFTLTTADCLESLDLSSNAALTNVDNLASAMSPVLDYLFVNNNALLGSLDAVLGDVTSVGYVWFTTNDALTSISMPSLTTMTDVRYFSNYDNDYTFFILACPMLTTISMPSLKTLTSPAEQIVLKDLTSVTTMAIGTNDVNSDPFTLACSSISCRVTITGASSLTSFGNSFYDLTGYGIELNGYGGTALDTTFGAIKSLSLVNSAIVDLDAVTFSAADTIEHIFLSGNSALDNIDQAASAISPTMGDLFVNNNALLGSLDGALGDVTSVGYVWFTTNDALTSISMPSLTTMTDVRYFSNYDNDYTFFILACPMLTTISMPSLKTLTSPAEQIVLKDLTSVTTMAIGTNDVNSDPFTLACSSISCRVTITGASSLTSFGNSFYDLTGYGIELNGYGGTALDTTFGAIKSLSLVNSAIVDLDAVTFSAADTIEHIFLSGNSALDNIDQAASAISPTMGDLFVNSNALLGSLDAVLGDVISASYAWFTTNDALTSISMPALTTVSGFRSVNQFQKAAVYVVNNAALENVYLPRLKNVPTAAVILTDLGAVQTFALGTNEFDNDPFVLCTSDSNSCALTVSGLASDVSNSFLDLAVYSFQLTQFAGSSLTLAINSVTSFTMSSTALANLDGVVFATPPATASFSNNAFEELQIPGPTSSLSVLNNANLAILRIDGAMTGADVVIASNAALHVIDAPAIVALNDVTVSNNPVLCSDEALVLVNAGAGTVTDDTSYTADSCTTCPLDRMGGSCDNPCLCGGICPDVGVRTGNPNFCTGVCGNQIVDGEETCDDDNNADGDGCTSCQVDTGFTCSGNPSICFPTCSVTNVVHQPVTLANVVLSSGSRLIPADITLLPCTTNGALAYGSDAKELFICASGDWLQLASEVAE